MQTLIVNLFAHWFLSVFLSLQRVKNTDQLTAMQPLIVNLFKFKSPHVELRDKGGKKNFFIPQEGARVL